MRTGTGQIAVLAIAAVMMMAQTARAADPCEADACAKGCADLCYYDSDEKKPGSGVPVSWLTTPIKYKINASKITAGLDKAKVIAAVKAAFKSWELPCTSIKFQYAGESTSFTEEKGHILVFWGNDKATWIYQDNFFWVDLTWTDYAKGGIEKALIGLNATPKHPKYSYEWTIGAAAQKFDIQTAVTLLIPNVIGFDVSKTGKTLNPAIFYNKVTTTLCKGHKDGAMYTYFKAGTGCTKPTSTYCGKTAPSTDGSSFNDGGPKPSDTGGSTADTGGSSGDTGGSSGDYTLPPGEDDGCCRVSHTRSMSSSLPLLTVLGLALLLGLARRRRR